MNVLLTSDWHETPFAEMKFETQKESLGEKIIQLLGSRGKDEVMAKIEIIIRCLGIKTVIHNGDLQENSKNEQGIVSEEDLDSASQIIANFETTNKVKVHLNAGNHELGYHRTAQPLATDPEGGMSKQSIANFWRVAKKSSIYQSFMIGDVQMIFVPYLMTETFGKDKLLVEEEKKYILTRIEKDLQKNNLSILFIHDPDSLMDKRLATLIRQYRVKIPLIFCGHYHAQITLKAVKWLIRIFNWKSLTPIRGLLRIALNISFDKEISKAVEDSYRQRREVPELMDEFNVQIIPAPGGMLGFGGGFLILDLDNLEIKRY